MLDPKLKDYAAPRQAEYIDAVLTHGGPTAAARALNVNLRTLQRAIKAVEARAALQGYSPAHDMTHTVPDGFKVRGVSTYYDSEGQPRGQWVKSSADEERRQEIIRAQIEALSEEIPRLDPLEGPAVANADLCNLFTMTDCHVGMLAWRKEAGADWDVKIAEKTLTGCFEQMVRAAPKAKLAIVNIAGDWNHYDGLLGVTPTSGHILDTDGRFSYMVAASIRILRRLCDVALMTHQEVYVVFQEGNHDLASSVWLRHMFAALYDREPRLKVNDSELPYYVYQHGQVMLGFHHGHLKKNDQLPLLFAAQFPTIWGATTKRYCHTGHRHTAEEREHSGMLVIQHPTLAARDAYAARGGWISERQATAITYHSKYGQVARNTVTPEMLEAA